MFKLRFSLLACAALYSVACSKKSESSTEGGGHGVQSEVRLAPG